MKKLKEEIVENLKSATKELIYAVKEEILHLEIDLINFKTDILKWMFLFWIGQILVTFGFILFLLKK